MVEEAGVLALIPARGGSKSLPRKNIRAFAGYPLMAYSIAAGQQAESVDRVLVSTDDEEIAGIARHFGAEVPFLRPRELARDDTLDLPVFEHALHWLEEEENYRPTIVVQLRPTSPLRPRDLVDRAVGTLLAAPEADSVRGVVPSGQNPYKMWRRESDGRLRPLLEDGPPESYNRPRQGLPPTFWQTGHIDVIRRSTILEQGSMSGQVVLAVDVDPRYTVDIDNELDWRRAEALTMEGELACVSPGRPPRPLPDQVDLLVLDFDGVLTDNRVWVDAEGREMVAAHRGDGWGLNLLRRAGVELVVLSTEANPVVAARCQKLGIPVEQGIEDKGPALRAILASYDVDPENVLFVGNDLNDIPCFPMVGCALVPADAEPLAKREADRILSARGGQGAVRELCDLLLERMNRRKSDDARD